MEAHVAAAVAWLLAAFSLPGIGLPAIFLVSLVSATLLPLGSEPVVYGYVLLTQAFWPAVLVATLGNTLGGIVSYGMGSGLWRLLRAWLARGQTSAPAVKAAPDPAVVLSSSEHQGSTGAAAGGKWHTWCVAWLLRLGPRALFFSWLPAVGDPLCAVAGYLRFAFWPSVLYMALGKFLRYVVMTAALLWFYSGPANVAP